METAPAFFEAKGGGSNIGAKMLVVTFHKEKFIGIFDCGTGMKPRSEGWDNVYLPPMTGLNSNYRICLFLTHGHQDHIGAAAALKKLYPKLEVYTTRQTAELTRIMGEDAIKIRSESGLPMHYDHNDLTILLESIKIMRSSDWLDIRNGFLVRFEPAGHICGASTVLLKTPYGIFADSGDISFYDTATVRGASKKLEDKIRWLSIDSTNGNIELPNPNKILDQLVADTLRVLKRGGNVLIPVFAIGRGPDVSIHLGRALKKYGYTVYSGGLLRKVAQSYHQYGSTHIEGDYHEDHKGKKVFNLKKENVLWVHGKNLPEVMGRGRQVVAIPSGMLEAGYSQAFLAAWADDPKNAVFLPGYQAEGTYGRQLIDSKTGDYMEITFPASGEKELFAIKAEIKKYSLSGHADGNQLAQWVQNMGTHDNQSLDKMFLVHGNQNGQAALKEKFLALPNKPKEILIAENGKVFTL